MNRLKKSSKKRVASWILGFSLSLSLIPMQAQADMEENVKAALRAAGASQEIIDAVSLQRLEQDATNVFKEAGEWTAASFGDVVRMAQQTGVALDELVPSVQGCIKDSNGAPMVGVSVVGIGILPGLAGSLVPLTAKTSGEGVPATVFDIPITTDFLSFEQRRNWGPGCYWMPIAPGLVDALVSVIRQESIMLTRVIPIQIGYKMNPPAKLVQVSGIVQVSGRGGVAVITNLDSAFALSGEDSQKTRVGR